VETIRKKSLRTSATAPMGVHPIGASGSVVRTIRCVGRSYSYALYLWRTCLPRAKRKRMSLTERGGNWSISRNHQWKSSRIIWGFFGNTYCNVFAIDWRRLYWTTWSWRLFWQYQRFGTTRLISRCAKLRIGLGSWTTDPAARRKSLWLQSQQLRLLRPTTIQTSKTARSLRYEVA